MRFPRQPATGDTADQLREQRLEGVKQLAERFVYDLGRLMAGHPAELEDYVSAPAAARLRLSLEPFLAAGEVMRPNFGEYGELRVEGDLLAANVPLTAEVEFNDQSVRETRDGQLMPSPRRRLRLTLTIQADLRWIVDFRLRRPSGE